MSKWTFEPGHTAAEFQARHMMVTYVRGAFKDVRGRLEFDPEDPRRSSVEATIDARKVWTGQPQRDAHLRSADFLDADNHPQITFQGDRVEQIGDHDYVVTGKLMIRGITRPVRLRVSYLGEWQTPWWEGGRRVGRQRTETAGRLRRDDGDQPPRFRRELERQDGQGRSGRR